MTAKEYLREIENLKWIIDAKQQERETLLQECGLSGIDPSKDRVQTTRRSEGRFTRSLEKAEELAREIDADTAKMMAVRHERIEQIGRIKNTLYAEILERRYVRGQRFSQMAEEMHYSEGYIRKMHMIALGVFEWRVLLEIEKERKETQTCDNMLEGESGKPGEM